jgi:hypothetical protein
MGKIGNDVAVILGVGWLSGVRQIGHHQTCTTNLLLDDMTIVIGE